MHNAQCPRPDDRDRPAQRSKTVVKNPTREFLCSHICPDRTQYNEFEEIYDGAVPQGLRVAGFPGIVVDPDDGWGVFARGETIVRQRRRSAQDCTL